MADPAQTLHAAQRMRGHALAHGLLAVATMPLSGRLRARAATLLRVFGDVRPGEALTVMLLMTNLFLVMTAYYVLKIAREPLILLGGGAEVKSYAAVGQALLLVGVASLYGYLANRFGRLVLIGVVTLFFVTNLLGFAAVAARPDHPSFLLGVTFFLWLGIFNLVTVTQFWSFAADLYDEETGKRLFPVIAIGSSVGAVGGSALAGRLLTRGSPAALMLVASAILILALGLTALTNRRAPPNGARDKTPPAGGDNAFRMVVHDRYLLLLAGLIFALNISTKTGDYALDRMLLSYARDHALADHGVSPAVYIGQFKAQFFGWINVLEVILQTLVVSRVIKYAGLRASLALVPIVSFVGYSAAFAFPIIAVVFFARVAESTLDYSLSNTIRQSLWLITSREAKYKAKQVVDSFVWRAGDTVSAAIVWIGMQLGFETRGFLAVNVVVGAIWVALALLAGTAHARRTKAAAVAPSLRPDAEAAPGVPLAHPLIHQGEPQCKP